ncbi:hypothetical protein [Leisingera sp. M658]|uniref:HD domain-containing protein n=1 Tax=Leisingera sp. M658 TaxID=2867015 RepID=UPI0021A777D4|nr:hypothetical protein [Leisingera sp. M658]UWQ75184.1 hypothetical protein K3724_01520 [Leisingera sp. M658]
MPYDLPIEFTSSNIYRSRILSLTGGDLKTWDVLAQSLSQIRRNCEPLLNAIVLDLPEHTDHSIKHVDALWQVVDQLIDNDYPMNPVEIFVIGCCFVLHDSAQSRAAYKDFENEFKNQLDHKNAAEILRENHAAKVRDLIREPIGVGSASYFIIPDPEFRAEFADIISEICASHWWSTPELKQRLVDRRLVNAPINILPACPSEWTINTLNLASLLRIADIAHCDARRAPLSQFNVRSKMNPVSLSHWKKQGKLRAPRLSGSKLVYNSREGYERSESPVWWASYHMLKDVDLEIKDTNKVLRSSNNGTTLKAEGVADVETPEDAASQTLKPVDWLPSDLSFRLDSISEIVSTLGGRALYGDAQLVPLRELLQNAVQATLMLPDVAGRVSKQEVVITVQPDYPEELSKDEIRSFVGDYTLEVKDSGIGMSLLDVQSGLLSVNKSHWSETAAVSDYKERVVHDTSNHIAKFGIGFLSVFMWSDNIGIRSQSFGSVDEVHLEFNDGLRSPPILNLNDAHFALHGTTISLTFNRFDWVRGSTFHDNRGGFSIEYFRNSIRQICPFPLVDIRIILGREEKLIPAEDWRKPTDTREHDERGWDTYATPRLKFDPSAPVFFSEKLSKTARAAYLQPSTHGSAIVLWNGFRVGRAAGWNGVIEMEPMSARREDKYEIDELLCRDDGFRKWLIEHRDVEWGTAYARLRARINDAVVLDEKCLISSGSKTLSIDEAISIYSSGRPLILLQDLHMLEFEDGFDSIGDIDEFRHSECALVIYFQALPFRHFDRCVLMILQKLKLGNNEKDDGFDRLQSFIYGLSMGFHGDDEVQFLEEMRKAGVTVHLEGIVIDPRTKREEIS